MDRRAVRLASGPVLSALVAGEGPPLVMIPGWSQSAAEFDRNIGPLSEGARVIALDMRGHGESEKPAGGYRIARLAHDLSEALDALGLERVDLLGHSMGSSVIWAYLDLFGPARLRKLVIVDQAPCAVARPHWSAAERLDAGCIFADGAAYDPFDRLIRTTGDVEGTMAMLSRMFTPALSRDALRWIAQENLKLPRTAAADLHYDHCHLDWREVIAAISLPTLVVGAETSIFSAESQRWIAGRIPGAELEIFAASEGGSHFMFLENPDRFNARVRRFLAG